MRIQGLSIGRCGPIEDLRRGGHPGGLDVLYVKDGAGKGALVGCLRGVLFGFQDQACFSARAENGDPVGGRVVLVDDGIEYTVERFLTNPDDVRVTRPDGVPASGADLQRLLNGIDGEAFGWRLRTVAAGAQASAQSELSALRDRVLATRHLPDGDSARPALEAIDVELESLLGAAGGGRIDRLVADLHELRARLEQARAAVAAYGDLRRAADHGGDELTQLADVLEERRAEQKSLRAADAVRAQTRERQLQQRQSEEAAEQARQELESLIERQGEVRREIAKTRSRLPAKPPPELIEIEKLRHILADLRSEISRSDRREELETARRRRVRPRRRSAAPGTVPEKPWWALVAALLSFPVAALVLVKGARFDSSTLLLVAALAVAATVNGAVQFRAWSTQSSRVRAAWHRRLREELKAAREDFEPEGSEEPWITAARQLSARLGMSTLPTVADLDLRQTELAHQEEERIAWDTVQIQLSALTWSLREKQQREVTLRAQLSAARDRLAASTAELLALAAKPSSERHDAVNLVEKGGRDAGATAPLAVIAEQIEATEREIERVSRESQPAGQACQELEESGELTGLENQWNVSMAELDLAVRRWRILAIARGLIEESVRERALRGCASLLSEASNSFSTATGGRYRGIVLDELAEGLAVIEEGGQARSVPGDLDAPTVRQLCLCLRLGLAMEEARKGDALPLLLDDVLERSGGEEARAMAEVLRHVSASQQVLYFTSNPVIRDLLVNAGADRVIEF